MSEVPGRGKRGSMSEPAKCRDCRRPDGGVRRINCETCGGSGLDVPPVDPEVLDRAVEAARNAYTNGLTRYTIIQGAEENNTERVESLKWKDALTAAAPIIAAAAYRQGREGLEARIEAKAGELDAMAQAQADEFGNYITSAGRSGEYKEGRADAYDDAAESLRSLLTDKEGEK